MILDICEIRPEFFDSLSVSGRKKGGVKKNPAKNRIFCPK